jgi:hypothetical protein
VEVAIGVDSHKGSLAAAVVDEVGKLIEAREFPNHRSDDDPDQVSEGTPHPVG